jgi:hypothetical protein
MLVPGGGGVPLAPRRRQGWPFRASLIVLAVGLIVSGVLTWLSSDLYSHNENRLLELRGRELGAVLSEALPNIQTPLASAAALAEATNADPKKFMRFIGPYVGAPPRHQFISVSLWRLGGGAPKSLVVVGAAPDLPTSSGELRGFFSRAAAAHKLTVRGILESPAPRLGYAFAATGANGTASRYLAYGEAMIPANRRSRLERNQAFSELNYAIYLGRAKTNQNLLVTSLKRLPVQGRQRTVRIPFGNTVLTLVVAPRQPLAGSLPQRLPWIILIVGVVLSSGAALLTSRLQQAVDQNRRLYAQQRTIAQTLQHALLPDVLPRTPGLDVGGRYQAGAEGVEIGGDWYDLITIDDGRLLLVVGDVSGRGLPAATAMAALRFAIHAYAAQGDEPEVFLPKLSGLLNVSEDKLLATVLCAVIDVPAHEITVTSAGHLPPLIISSRGSEFVDTPAGLPVGIERDASYSSTVVSAPPGATLLAFTDGLVERRGESIEVGLERLRSAAGSDQGSLDALLTHVLSQLHEDASDDTAVAGIQWMS